MSVVYTADIFCDKCSNWVHGVTADKTSGIVRKALAVAKEEGWSRDVRSTYLDLCPKCLTEFMTAVPNAKVSEGENER